MHLFCLLLQLTAAQIIIIKIIRKVKANVMPVIIGANGTILESLVQNLINIIGKHETNELQKQPH
jgi:hypothetical protein